MCKSFEIIHNAILSTGIKESNNGEWTICIYDYESHRPLICPHYYDCINKAICKEMVKALLNGSSVYEVVVHHGGKGVAFHSKWTELDEAEWLYSFGK